MTQVTSARRRHKPAEVRRQEILKAARQVFSEDGYRGADVNRIAAIAGVGKGTVYRLFDHKEALFLGTLDSSMEELSEQVNAGLDEIDDPVTLLTTAITRYFEYFDRCPEIVELFIQERAEFRSGRLPTYFAYKQQRKEAWLDRYQKLEDQGLLGDIPIDMAMDLTGDLIYGVVLAHRLSGEDGSLTERVPYVIELALRGILRRDSKPSA